MEDTIADVLAGNWKKHLGVIQTISQIGTDVETIMRDKDNSITDSEKTDEQKIEDEEQYENKIKDILNMYEEAKISKLELIPFFRSKQS